MIKINNGGDKMKLNVRKKLALSFTLVILVCTIMNIFNIIFYNKIHKLENSIIRNRFEHIQMLESIDQKIIRLSKVSDLYLIKKGEGKEQEQLKLNKEELDSIRNDFNTFSESIIDEDERKLFDQLNSEVSKYISNLTLLSSKLDDDYNVDDYIKDNNVLFTNVEKGLEDVRDYNKNGLEEETNNIEEIIASGKEKCRNTIGLSFILGGIVCTVIANKILKSIDKIGKGIDAISKGDLTVNVDINTKDEMEEMAEKVNKLAKDLGNIILSIRAVANQVSTSSQELSATSEETHASNEEITSTIVNLTKGISNQNDVINDSTNMVKTMFNSIVEASKNIDRVAKGGRRVVLVTDEGLKQVNNAVRKMDSIKAVTRELQDSINDLGNYSEEIGKIVGVIKEIADETNLLALNAAIESARAGEQGKGFAVVADEVRTLAEGCSKSAEEISIVIQTIQNEIFKSVEKIATGIGEVVNGAEAVDNTGKAFDVIAEEISHVSDELKKLEKLSDEVGVNSEKVVKSIKGISSISDKTAASSEKISAAANEQVSSMEIVVRTAGDLANLSINLQKMVDTFKL